MTKKIKVPAVRLGVRANHAAAIYVAAGVFVATAIVVGTYVYAKVEGVLLWRSLFPPYVLLSVTFGGIGYIIYNVRCILARWQRGGYGSPTISADSDFLAPHHAFSDTHHPGDVFGNGIPGGNACNSISHN